MSNFGELHGLRNGVAKLDAEIEELSRTLRLTQAMSPGSQAASKIIAELQRCEATYKEMLHELSIQEADSWRSFRDRFMELTREEQARTNVITKGKVLQAMDKMLGASCNYGKHPEGLERGKPEQGLICLLDTPPHGVWNYSDGISENFRERVRLCVAEAGRALHDYPKGADREDFWLHRLYLDLLKNNSDLLFCGSKEGGMIFSVCVASATFCARLERLAIQQSEPGGRTGADRLRTGANQAEPSPDQNSYKTAQSAEGKSRPGSPASWQEIEITFLSDERVEICNGGKNRETRNYAELGFEDRRNGKPNLAWVTLRELAREDGKMPQTRTGAVRAAFQKRIEEIREKLRAHFGIEADPIPFNGNSYQASFRLACRPSFET